jgi:single-strand DNA-binding protein
MLRVTLLGNLGADPEQRFTTKGTQAVVFNVAVNQIRRGPDGERQENTEWFRIHVTGPKTDFAGRLSRGNRVLVVGRLSISHYTSKDGEARTAFDVWADELQGMGQPSRDPDALADGDSDGHESAAAEAPVAAASGGRSRAVNGRGANAARTAEETEDLPF